MSNSRPRRKPMTRVVFSLVALVMIAFPCWIVLADLKKWDKAQPVTGKVVRVAPEGPFPDMLTVAYQDLSDKAHQVEIGVTYATARKVGDPVELIYLHSAPAKAMTRIQQHDEGWSVSPYVLFACLGAAVFALHFAFPEYISLKTRKPR